MKKNDESFEILESVSNQLSSWLYDLEKNGEMNKLLSLTSYPFQDVLKTAREASKMLRVLESQGVWVDLHGTNAGVEREGRDDEEYRAAIALGEKLKVQNATFDTIVESITSAFQIDFNQVKILEKNTSPQLGARQIWVEVDSLRNYDVAALVNKVKGAGIIVIAAVLKQKDTFILTDNQNIGDEVGFDNGKFGSIRPFLKGSFTLDDEKLGLDRGKLGY